MLACHRGFQDIVEELIFSCAKVNLKDKEGTTALMRAAKNGFRPIVDMLISNGASVRAKNKVGPAHRYARQLIPNGVLAWWRSSNAPGCCVACHPQLGNTALVWAASEGRLDCLEALLEANAKVDTRNSVRGMPFDPLREPWPHCRAGALPQSGRTALHWAISNGRDDIVNVLLANGANVELRDNVRID